MIDYHKEITAALSEVLPTYYELHLTKDALVPCFSYMEAGNYDDATGDTLGYSVISYQVKVWATDVATIQVNALLADAAMRGLGFKRTSAAELHDRNSSMIQKVMIYEALGLENY
jgi:hypothetical protein